MPLNKRLWFPFIASRAHLKPISVSERAFVLGRRRLGVARRAMARSVSRRFSERARRAQYDEFNNATGRERLRLFIPYSAGAPARLLENWSKQPATTLRYRTYELAQRMLASISVAESFLKSIDVNTRQVEIHYNADE